MANSNASKSTVSAAIAALVGDRKLVAQYHEGKLFVAAALTLEDFTDVKSRAGEVWLKEGAFAHVDVGNGLEANCIKLNLVHVRGSDGIFFVPKKDNHQAAVEKAFRGVFKVKKGEKLPALDKMEEVLKVLGVTVEG